jgi:hypothetical protein
MLGLVWLNHVHLVFWLKGLVAVAIRSICLICLTGRVN